MKKKSQNSLENVLIMGIPLLVFVVWILTCWPINYQVHDDRYMMEFVSGKFLGYGDAHLIYIKYILGLVLLLFYRIFPGYDWYAAMLFAVQVSCMAVFSWYLLRKQKKIVTKIMTMVVFYAFFILCWLNEIVCFTYTTVAALVSATILVVYVLGEDRIKDFVLIFILCFLSYNIRSDLFFMILPFAGVLWIYKLAQSKDKKHVWFLFVLGIILVCSYAVEQFGYVSGPWSEYKKYNEARTLVYDYYYTDMVNYEDYKDVYDELGITENGCQIIESYDLSLYDDTLYNKMEELATKYHSYDNAIEKMVKTVKSVLKDGILEGKMMTLVSILFWMIAIGCLLLTKSKRNWIFSILFVLLHIGLWLYLGYRGRILPRVSHSMLLLQLILPLLIIFLNVEEQRDWGKELIENKSWKRAGIVGLGIVCLGVAFYDVHVVQKWLYKNGTEAASKDQYIIEEYCASHPENFYFLDVFSVTECKYTFDFNNNNAYENFVSLGDWFGNSPLYEAKLEKEEIDSVRDAVLHNNSIYVIGIKGKKLDYIKGITEEEVTIEPVDFLDGGMDDYIVYAIQAK